MLALQCQFSMDCPITVAASSLSMIQQRIQAHLVCFVHWNRVNSQAKIGEARLIIIARCASISACFNQLVIVVVNLNIVTAIDPLVFERNHRILTIVIAWREADIKIHVSCISVLNNGASGCLFIIFVVDINFISICFNVARSTDIFHVGGVAANSINPCHETT